MDDAAARPPRSNSTRPLILVLTAFTAIVSLNLFFIALTRGWFGEYSGAGKGFCECMRSGLIKQPANTWSNLGFVAAGLAMAWSLAKGTFNNNRNALTENAFNAVFFSSLVVLLGPGSMAMHASGTRLGGFFDVLSMYLIDGFMVAYSAQRLFRLESFSLVLIFGSVLSTCLIADKQPGRAFFYFGWGNAAFGGFILLTTVMEAVNIFLYKIKQTPAWGFASFGAITLAFFVWNMSRTNAPWCVPESLIQGHAIWHLLDAVSVYCLFRYYVSEQSTLRRDPRLNEPQMNADELG